MTVDRLDDELVLASEDNSPPRLADGANNPWTVLIVDDEEDVHAVTKLVLTQFRYANRPLRLLHAYSAAEAKRFLTGHDDIALILLDVVMESDDAGLRLVEYIRNELQNRLVRIVLRTGQPGQAPERRVIAEYDINDYKAKTELTAQKLYTTTLTALRAYEHIIAVDASRRGLEQILEGAASVFELRSMELFACGVLKQISALLGVSKEGILCVYQGGAGRERREELYILASTGAFERMNGALLDNMIEPPIADAIILAMRSRHSIYTERSSTLYFNTPNAREIVVHIETSRLIGEHEQRLIEAFCKQVSIGMDTLQMFDDLAKAHAELKLAHKATVVTLADLAESRDPDTGAHVLRVATMTEAIARVLQSHPIYGFFIDEPFLEAVGPASIMHDVGKVATPDRILQKPGKLDQDERAIMETHASLGQAILEKANDIAQGSSRYLQLGAEIAGNHHEWFDGSGYPRGLTGTNIPLSARIVAVGDVFDALTHARVYKAAWSREAAIAYIRERSGTQFDPFVVDAFLEIVASVGAPA